MAGDEARAAVAEAYRAHYRRLVAMVYAATGDFGEAQDAVQEAYARALDRPGQFLSVGDPQAWLRTVALNFARQRWRRRQIFDRLVRFGRVPRPADSVPGLSGDWVDLTNALRRLSRPVRETLVLHHLLDLPVTVEADTDWPAKAVRTAIDGSYVANDRRRLFRSPDGARWTEVTPQL